MTSSPLSYGPFISRNQAKEQGLKAFYTGKPCKHGHVEARLVSNYTCFACHRDRQKKDRDARPDVYKQRRADYYDNNKDEILQKQREHYASSPEKRARVRLTNTRWVQANREKSRQIKRTWYLKTRETRRQYRNQQARMYGAKYRKDPVYRAKKIAWNRGTDQRRRLRDPAFRIKNSLYVRMRAALSDSNAQKSDRFNHLLGATPRQVKEHLEKKFLPGMNWQNYGFYGWHIDHIRPCSSFDLTDPEQQKQCFHYTNLQPLWAKDNLAKSDRWEPTHPD